MNSIVPECTLLKHDYEKCFNHWFSSKFLKGQSRLPKECDELFERYKNCIKPFLEKEMINNQ
jgi:TRIAP1/MDM35 family protein